MSILAQIQLGLEMWKLAAEEALKNWIKLFGEL